MLIIVIIELITGIIILKYVHGFIKARRYPKPVMSCLHQEVKDLMQATKQIKEGWSEVIGMMDHVRDRQSHFFSNIRTLSKGLCESRQLERGDISGNLVYPEQDRMYVDTVDSLVTKLVNMRQVAKKQEEALVDTWPQDSNVQEIMIVTSDESFKDSLAVIKKVLNDFLKDNRKNIKSDREGIKKNIRGMTDGLKESIVNVLSGKVVSQKGEVPAGVVSTEKHERARQLSTKMLRVQESLKIVEIDVSSTKGILDTIDGQLDEICGKLELDKKFMNKQCRETSARMTAVVEEVDRQAGVVEETGGALTKVMAEMQPELQKVQVEEVCEMLHRFGTRMEMPMKKLVCSMRFLYQTMVCLPKGMMKNHERGDVPDEETQGGKMAERKVRSLLKDFRVRSKSQKRPMSAMDFYQTQAPHSMRQSVSLESRGGAFLFKNS